MTRRERSGRKVCKILGKDPDEEVGIKQKTGVWLWAPRWVFYAEGGYAAWMREKEKAA
jgi:hypothetical protein